eukprot:jgi/Psemu1/319795/estExt_fgenesh1_pm.C_2990002
MGNTCYLNSSIQCLSHTPIFRDYFTSKCYLNDINRTNPLGYEGQLAQVSAVLISSIWKRFNQQPTVHQQKRVTAPGSYLPVNAPALTPKTFKEALGKFNEHFAGNEQHDAQELLAFLLGGLSEDLNRIQNKPYIEAPDSDGRPDSELADIWWSNHLKREMSIVVAMFTGQYKSLLKCKSCKYESARFEPFSFLQVPLPEDDTIPVSLIFYSNEPSIGITQYSVRVHNNGTLYDVLISLAEVIYADEQAKEDDQESDEEKSAEADDTSEDVTDNCAFLALAQRRSELLSKELIHPLTHRVFGTPLLLRVADLDSVTGSQIYDIVAKHLKQLVPHGALKFLTGTDSPSMYNETITSDLGTEDLTTKEEIRQTLEKATSDTEEVSAGTVPRYGFRLRLVSREGRRCSICPWYECCIGCLVPDDGKATVVGQGVVVTLEDCLDAFAKEEKIPEAYCSKCKDFQVQTKRMSLWRLPPVVIIQLKRFQFTQHMRRKLRDFVQFPVEGLDLSRIMATDGTIRPSDIQNRVSREESEKNGSDDAHEEDSSSHMNGDNGRGEKLYDLYGVVHHQGALSGGHYVASLKSDIDGQWRLFNDAQVYEIHDRDVVDSSAYILFYIRRDVANQKLSDFWDVRKRVGGGLSEKEMDALIKGQSEQCVIC